MNKFYEQYSVDNIRENYIGKYTNKDSKKMGFLLEYFKPAFILLQTVPSGSKFAIIYKRKLINKDWSNMLAMKWLSERTTRRKLMDILKELGYSVEDDADNGVFSIYVED